MDEIPTKGRKHIKSLRVSDREHRVISLLAIDSPSISDYLRGLVVADARKRLPELLDEPGGPRRKLR